MREPACSTCECFDPKRRICTRTGERRKTTGLCDAYESRWSADRTLSDADLNWFLPGRLSHRGLRRSTILASRNDSTDPKEPSR